MTKKVSPLPGVKCQFYKHGRCHYEESLNPGLHSEHKCRILVQWEDKFDDFISRVDKFGLDSETAGRIWSERMKEFFAQLEQCPDFQEGGEASEIGCIYAWFDVCLLKLPSCPGQCSHFKVRESSKKD